MSQFSVRNDQSICEALRKACERREILILTTPYMRFESNFLRLEAEAVHVAASMSWEDATFGLKSPELRMRFPYGFSFVEGPTALLGLGIVNARKSLRLAIPAQLAEDDMRCAYRVERVGRVPVTFSTRKYELISGALVNVSTTGARIQSIRDFEDDEMLSDDLIAITIPLAENIYINTMAKVRYVKGRTVGMEFRPVLAGALLEDFSRWVFLRQEEDRERAANRLEPATADNPDAGSSKPFHQGIILVSSGQEMEPLLNPLLTGLGQLSRISPTVQAMRDVDTTAQGIVLFHVRSTTLDEKRRLKTLVETLGGRFPVVFLATDVEPAVLSELANDLKAAASYVLTGKPSPFLNRLLQGIFRRHFGGQEPPRVAPESGA